MYQYTTYTGGRGRHNNFAQGAEYSGAGPAARSSALNGEYRLRRSFVYPSITVFVSSTEARLLSDAVPPSQDRLNRKSNSTLKFLCRGTKKRSDLARHAPSSRAATWYQLCDAMQRTLPRKQSLSGLTIQIRSVRVSATAVTFTSVLSNNCNLSFFLQYLTVPKCTLV
jgi:hypothetical protein